MMSRDLVYKFWALVFWILALPAHSQSVQSFSYTGPVCRNNTNPSPVTSAGWLGGGTFSASPSGIFVNAATGVINVVTSAPGTYTVTYSGGACACTVSATVAIYNPLNPVIAGSNSVCAGKGIQLTASGASSYTWSTGFKGPVISVTPAVSTVYTVTAPDLNGCTGSKNHSVSVVPLPGFTVPAVSLCSGSSAILKVSGASSGDISYFWQPGNVNGTSFEIMPLASRIYTVTGTLAGCSVTRQVAVSVLHTYSPVVSFDYALPLCTNQENALPVKVDGFTPGGTFVGRGGDGFSDPPPVDPSTGSILLNGLKAGTYKIEYYIPTTSLSAVGCTAAAHHTAIVAVIEPTPLTISPDVGIVEGGSTTLSVSGGENYIWEPVTALSCSDCAQPEASPVETTSYCVTGRSNGCDATACVNVEVSCFNTNDLSVPNAFTPNSDGNNEQFCLRGWERCNRLFSIKIFNRWGEMVYESSEPDFCWDGTLEGTLLDADVYVYVIRAFFGDEPVVIKSGNITLIR